MKTWGIRGRILSAIEGLPGIECAFIFGSFASGGTHHGSDVDVLVIGSIDHAVLSNAMTAVSSDVGRTANAKLYRPAEWRRKLGERNSFLESVAGGSKIFLLGDEEVLNDVGKPRASRGEEAAEPPSASWPAIGRRKKGSSAAFVEANRLRAVMQYQGADVDIPDSLIEALQAAVNEAVGKASCD